MSRLFRILVSAQAECWYRPVSGELFRRRRVCLDVPQKLSSPSAHHEMQDQRDHCEDEQ